MKKMIKRFFNLIGSLLGLGILNNIYNLLVFKEFSLRMKDHKNPINKTRFFGFSQSEEDGIILEIMDRIKLKNGYFVEFGVGDGLENNTIILLASEWSGAWFGGQNLAFNTKHSKKLLFNKVWITKDNIVQLYKSLNKDADLISLDLDGNDIYLVEKLLSDSIARPKVFIVEYNGKFPPNIKFRIDYDDKHSWNKNDYFGASLLSFYEVFNKHGYRLVCCNLSGANAFFVLNEYAENFSDIPTEIGDLYSEPFYFIRNKKMHPTSPKTLEKLIR